LASPDKDAFVTKQGGVRGDHYTDEMHIGGRMTSTPIARHN